jgi:hypothetical protein
MYLLRWWLKNSLRDARNKHSLAEVWAFVKKILWFALLAGISGALASVLTDPASALRGNGSRAPILVSAHADQNVLTIIERSCQNCHSSNTEWPFA